MGIPLPITATPDERSFRAAGDRAERTMADAGRKAGKSFSDAISGAAKDAEGALKKFGDKASDAYDKAKDAAGRLRVEQQKLDELQRNGAGNQKLITQSENVEKARRAEARAIRSAKDALADYNREAEKGSGGVGRSIVQELSNQMGSGRLAAIGRSGGGELVSGLMAGSGEAGAAGLTIGAALGGGIAIALVAAMSGLQAAIADGMASLRIKDLMQTRMGIDDTTMHRVGDAAGRAYAAGFGESIQDNLKAIQFGLQGGLIKQDASADDIAKYTQRIQTTSQVMDEDPNAVAKGARNLIRTGLVKDYTEALDLLTVAQQKGLNLSKDLLDTAEEYGTAWHGVGLSAQDAFGLMKQMSDAGIRNTDVAADSIKELSINVSDGSKLTRDAFKALGFDADELKKRFAEGGPAAREALGAVLTALNDVQDPLDKNNIGLALFKTKWEDAKTAIQAANLKTAASEMGAVSGETDNATRKINEHADAWEQLGRRMSVVWTNMSELLANDPFVHFIETTFPNFLNEILSPKPDTSGYTNPNVPRPAANPVNPANPGALTPPGTGTITGIPGQGFLGNALGTQSGPPPPPGMEPPKPPPGVQHGAQSHMPSADEDSKAKFNAPASQWSLDNVPLGRFPGEEGISARPTSPAAAAPGQVVWGTGGDPYGKPGYGYYQVDQGRVFDAESAELSAKTSLQNARFRMLEVEAKADATEQEKYNARAQLVQAGRSLQSAEAKLAEAQQGTWKKVEDAAKGFSSGMDQIGAALDKDFGLSKGLPGLAENLTKFIANLAAAPLLGQLNAVAQANPSKGGYGAVGIAAAQGAFGPQYTGLPQGGYAAVAGAAGVPMAGYGSDAALLANIPAGRYERPDETPVWDLTKGLGDCSSAVEDLVNMIDGRPTGGRQMSTGNAAEWLTSRGFLPGSMPGAFNVGFNPSHMQATLPGGTNFNWGSNEAAAQRGMDGGQGAFDPAFTSHFYRPMGGSPAPAPAPQASPSPAYTPTAPGLTVTGNPAAGGYDPVLSDPSLANPGLTPPGAGALPPAGGGGGLGPTGTGPSRAYTPRQYGGVEPASGSGKGGIGMTPGGTLDTAMGLAASGLDLMAPGAGQAAQTGMKLANRAIQYGGQVAGIGVQGLMDTFLPTGGSELANHSWFTKILGGIAGAAPALPNMAGKATAESNPAQGGQPGQAQPAGNTTNINVTNNRATEDGTGRDIAYHQQATNSAPGMT